MCRTVKVAERLSEHLECPFFCNVKADEKVVTVRSCVPGKVYLKLFFFVRKENINRDISMIMDA